MANNTIHIHEIPQELDPMEMDGSELLVVSNPDSEMNDYETNKLSINQLSEFVNRDGGSSSLDQVYPVGSIYITVSNTFNPNRVFGGTWSVIGDGRCLFGLSQGNSNAGAYLSGILPDHKHSYTYYTSSKGYNFDYNGSNGITGVTDISGNDGSTGSVSGLPSGITAASTGTTYRPPSIGVIFWKRES